MGLIPLATAYAASPKLFTLHDLGAAMGRIRSACSWPALECYTRHAKAVFTIAARFFSLTPATAGGTWTETVLHSFLAGSDGSAPDANVVMGSNRVLCGTTYNGGKPARSMSTGPAAAENRGAGGIAPSAAKPFLNPAQQGLGSAGIGCLARRRATGVGARARSRACMPDDFRPDNRGQ